MTKKRCFPAIKIICSSILCLSLVVGFIGIAFGSEYGEWWTSSVEWNSTGLSTVGTTNISGTGKSINFWVLRANKDEMGYANKWVENGKAGSHSCWGQPFLDRYGSIQVPGGKQRNPYFHVNG